MGTSESRLARLMAWIDEQFSGNVAGFCRYYNLKPATASFIYQLMGGGRQFGERAARTLEEACGRPAGWLDTPFEITTNDPINYDRALCAKLPARDRQLIEDFIKLVLTRNESRVKSVDSPQVGADQILSNGPGGYNSQPLTKVNSPKPTPRKRVLDLNDKIAAKTPPVGRPTRRRTAE